MKRKTNLIVFSFVCLGTIVLTGCGQVQHTHTFVEQAAVAPTCTEPGYAKHYTCSADSCKGKVFDVDKKETTVEKITLSSLGHDVGTPTVTWEDDVATGKASCKRTGCMYEVEESKTGSWVSDSSATCQSKEKGHYHVTFDNTRLGSADSPQTEVGELGNHHLVEVAGQAETCTAPGYLKHYSCDVPGCGKLFSDETGTHEITDLEVWKTTEGQGKINPHAHPTQLVAGQAETCLEPGYKDAYKCSECNDYFEEQAATNKIGNEEAYNAWKSAGGKLNPHAHHDPIAVPGQAETCTTPGAKDAWKCTECGLYFSANTLAEDVKIGNEEAYNTWKVIPAHAHTLAKVDGKSATCTVAGYKDAWKCSECKNYFSSNGTNPALIGNEEAYNTWKASGAGKINPTGNHTLGSVVPATNPTRSANGVEAHKRCSVCNGYFTTTGEATTLEALSSIKPEVLKASFDTTLTETSYDLPHLPLSERLVVDVKFNGEPTGSEAVKIWIGDGWSKYIGRIEIKRDANGNYYIADNYSAGLNFAMTEDGYFRMYINQAKITKGQDISSMTEYNLIVLDGNSTSGVGEVRVNPHDCFGENQIRGQKFKFSGWTYIDNGFETFTLDQILCIDVKFINTTNFTFCLQDDWGTATKTIKLSPEGKLLTNIIGVDVMKVNDKDGLAGGFYRIRINLAYVNYNKESSDKADLKKVNRITVTNNSCEAYVDFNPFADVTCDPWLTFAGNASANVPMEFSIANACQIRDTSSGEFISGKQLYFEVKGAGSGKVKFALMDVDASAGWHNMGNMVLTFTDGAVTDCVIQGTANKWPTYAAKSDGVFGITIPFDKLSGDGISGAYCFDYIYGGTGIEANGVTSFSMNLGSISLIAA